MSLLNKITRTRLIITIVVIAFLMYISVHSMILGHIIVTEIAIGGIIGSGLMYKHVETKRKSDVGSQVPGNESSG